MNREFSAGGVVYKKVKKQNSKQFELLWLVTKSTPSKLFPESVWRLPKGWLDDKDGGKNPGPLASGIKKASERDLRNAALTEVKEEGGVRAKIIKKIGSERYFYTHEGSKILKFVTFYLMEWQANLAEGPGFETEEVAWLAFDKARKKLKYSREKKILEKARVSLDQGVQESLI
jgi:8-oxo-dGTP pyrophosphatase MutT (NUDIX family)